jgi:hypothetical protein
MTRLPLTPSRSRPRRRSLVALAAGAATALALATGTASAAAADPQPVRAAEPVAHASVRVPFLDEIVRFARPRLRAVQTHALVQRSRSFRRTYTIVTLPERLDRYCSVVEEFFGEGGNGAAWRRHPLVNAAFAFCDRYAALRAQA